MQKKDNIINVLTVSYFVMAFFEVVAEYLVNKTLIFSLKPIIPLILIVIYLVDSEIRNMVFVVALFLSLITNILFIPNTADYLFYGVFVFTLHRILMIYIILSTQKLKDFIPLIIATTPFLLIFFYLFLETAEIPENSFYILIFQNLLISTFAGIALSSYVMNDNKQNSILLISALIFVMLQFVVFVEKYFLINEYEKLFRPVAMTLNALAFFSFYKYIIVSEKSNDDRLS